MSKEIRNTLLALLVFAVSLTGMYYGLKAIASYEANRGREDIAKGLAEGEESGSWYFKQHHHCDFKDGVIISHGANPWEPAAITGHNGTAIQGDYYRAYYLGRERACQEGGSFIGPPQVRR